MAKHEIKSCPKCGHTFECKMGDIANCQCNSILLNKDTVDFLSKTFFDCLCKDCLRLITEQLVEAKLSQFPATGDALVEGLHYYQDSGYWVFTELYHYLRGYCCKSGCRHCVYGFSKFDPI